MKYVIGTRAIFSFTRYEMLAYCCNTKKNSPARHRQAYEKKNMPRLLVS